ncbi:MAG: peptidase [Candidatus Latescibacterota bacterium]|nr:MAG: peptidase [Candidatus Latescibacterota bacterium]
MDSMSADLFDAIVTPATASPPKGVHLGRSRENRPIVGYRFGTGDMKISLIGGCHADEPVGPQFLNRLVSYLSDTPDESEILTNYQWWIVSHINPDGADRNRVWYQHVDKQYDLSAYLTHVVREQPGDDIEFGFPRSSVDHDCRPENRAVYDWWKTCPRPFALHVSLHGMAFAGGPWFLIDPDWVDRCPIVKQRCREAVNQLRYNFHDVQRHGEKGFERIERGFCTRPNSLAMAQYFVDRNDPDTAALFRPSSMETIRSHGGDPLTLVSEIPLFIVPGVGESIEPNDPIADKWRERVLSWKTSLENGEPIEIVAGDTADSDASPMPIRDQMRFQWIFVTAGIEQISATAPSG